MAPGTTGTTRCACCARAHPIDGWRQGCWCTTQIAAPLSRHRDTYAATPKICRRDISLRPLTPILLLLALSPGAAANWMRHDGSP
jgi:hypothetical protein